MTNPAPTTLIADALAVAGQPSPGHSPHLRLIAWASLKSASGQPILQTRLNAIARANAQARAGADTPTSPQRAA